MLLTTSEIKIKGELLAELPHDLYIPPEVLEASVGRNNCKALRRM